MSYQGRRRAPRKRLRDRIRAWRYGKEEEQELTDDHGNHIGQDLPPVQRWPRPERPVIRTAEVGGVYLPLSDDQPYNPAWMPCWARQDVPRPGRVERRIPGEPWSVREPAGPGYLSAFASPFGAPGHIPPTPRPAARPVTWWLPRECAGRITALAGAW